MDTKQVSELQVGQQVVFHGQIAALQTNTAGTFAVFDYDGGLCLLIDVRLLEVAGDENQTTD